MVVTIPEKVDSLCKLIIQKFDAFIPTVYTKEDRERGHIVGKDRMGNVSKMPFVSVSIGVVTNIKRKISHVGEIGEIGAELKEYAKSLQGSNYVTERRHREN